MTKELEHEFPCGCKIIDIESLERCDGHKEMDEKNKDKIYIPVENKPWEQ